MPAGMRVARVAAGFDMVVLGDNDFVSSSIYNRHHWEISNPHGMALKAGVMLPHSGTFLDIGANLGYYSLLFAQAGYNVVAVEAMTRNRRAIEGSLCLNPELRSRVKIVPVALVSPDELSSTTCVIESTNSRISVGNGALSCGAGKTCQAGDANCEVVPVKTLDMVLADVAPTSVDVVKMDVEVHECQVLAGGGSLFSTFHPQILQIETAFGDTGKCVQAKAAEHSYRTKIVKRHTFMVLSSTPDLSESVSPAVISDPVVDREGLPEDCVPTGMRKARVAAGFDMVVLGDNDIVSASIYRQHVWEISRPHGMAAKAGAVLPHSGTFLDIGANLGYYSLLFAQAGYNVVAVEAMTRNRRAIEGSLCLNPQLRSRVKIVPVALVSPDELSSTTCVIKSTNSQINVGNGALSCGAGKTCQAGDANCEVVPVKTLDMVLADIAPTSVDVVKMDVEVHECQVLAGGGSLFSTFHPQILQIETAFGDSGKCVEAAASEHGYRTKTVQGDTVMVASDSPAPIDSMGADATPAAYREPVVAMEKLPRDCVPTGMRKARVAAGFDMVVLGNNDIVSASIYSQHVWEISTPNGMAAKAGAVLPHSGTFLDIGANLGYYSLLFAQAGYNVVAVEAMTRNRRAIEGSLCLNPQLRSRVKIVPVALVSPDELSSTTCVIKSTNSQINVGNGALSCGAGKTCQAGDANCEVVPVKTLDMVLADIAPTSVDVVKMDVEVHECQVLAGGGSLFSTFHPQILQIETAFGDSGKCVEAAASEHGYRTKTVQGDTVMVASDSPAPIDSMGADATPAAYREPVVAMEKLPRDCVPTGMRKARVAAGFDMVVLGNNDIVSASIYSRHVWEISTPNGMAAKAGAVLPHSGTFLDIGANLGYYSLLFAQAGYNVVAVEAMTRNRRAIEGSLCLNPHLRSRVKIVPVALVSPDELSSTTCVIKSTNSQINVGNGALSCGAGKTCQAGDANCEVVPVKTLDMVLADIAPTSVDVVKMDVEVHECQVLAGGGSLFSTFHPQILQIETAFGDSGKCVEAAASEHGYRTKTVQGDTVMVASDSPAPIDSMGADATPAAYREPVVAMEKLPRDCVPTGMRKARVAAGFDMVVLGNNDIVSASIYSQHVWEISTPNGMAAKAGAVLPHSGTFLDIGANLGYYSLLFAQAGYNVVAVEAMTRNRRAIEGSLCLNPQLRSRVKIVPVALVSPDELSSTTCVIKSTNSQINVGNGALSCGAGKTCQAGDANCEVVPVKTLDMVLADIAPTSVDVVKMDVEVHECQVLAGGGSLFSTFHPQILQIETAFGDSGKCVEAAASEHGYRTKTVQGDTVMVASDSPAPVDSMGADATPAAYREPVVAMEKLPRDCVPTGMRKARVAAGFDMVVLGNNDIVSASIYSQHVWEISTPNGMAAKAGAVLPHSGTFLDIGANLGYYSLLFAQAGYNVVAVEAMTRNRRAIEGSLCLNPHLRSRVKIVPVALVSPDELSSTTCVIKSTNSQINVGNGALSCGAGKTCQAGDANCEVVPVKTLDMVLADIAPTSVDMVKMDVEVHECQVLAGGGSLFSTFHPQILQIETAFGDSGKCVEAAASEHGYRTKTVQGDTVMVASGS